jgi:hypothetical protein
MYKKLLTKSIFYIFLVLIFFAFPRSEVFAQKFKMELANPTTSISAGSNFDVNIMINTEGKDAINGDALINYENSYISVVSAKTGNFFTYFTSNPLGGSTSKYLVSSWEESIVHSKKSSTFTLFATLTLNAKAGGTTTLAFDCQANTEADSNINAASDSKDMIVCPLEALSVTIGGSAPNPTSPPAPTSPPSGLNPTSTPRPTVAPVPTTAYTQPPQELPRSGIFEVTVAAVAVGAALTVAGILLIL